MICPVTQVVNTHRKKERNLYVPGTLYNLYHANLTTALKETEAQRYLVICPGNTASEWQKLGSEYRSARV